MLTQVAPGVLVHQSAFVLSNAVVVQGSSGVLLVDPGITVDEMACLAADLDALGAPVVVAFATHPDWDHTLWHPALGSAPRYGTALAATVMRETVADAGAMARIADHLPPEIHGRVPMAGLGLIRGLPDGATRLPWDGPAVRLLEHRGHCRGHAALLVEDRRVLVAGDMLSDVLVPMLDLDEEVGDAADPVGDYLAGLSLLEDAARDADVVVPGHGNVGGAAELQERLARDRAYVLALRDGRDPDDPRLGAAAAPGWEWVTDVHEWQAQRLGRAAAAAEPSAP